MCSAVMKNKTTYYERHKKERKAYQKVYYAKLKETQEIKSMPIKRSQPKSEAKVDYVNLPWEATVHTDGTITTNKVPQAISLQTQKSNNYMQNAQGDKSSKRLIAFLLAALEIGVMIMICWCGIKGIEIANQALISEFIKYGIIGIVLLGVGGTAAESVLPILKLILGKKGKK